MRCSRLESLLCVLILVVCNHAVAAALQCARQDCIGHGHNALLSLMQQCVAEKNQADLQCPCVAADANKGGYVLLKDCKGRSQFLLIPSQVVKGIEDPVLQKPDAPNYFAVAWQNRFLVEQALGYKLAPDRLSLALNPQSLRSQDQLHIHIDCISTEVRQQLQSSEDGLTTDWRPLPFLLKGHAYRAMRVNGETLSINPVTFLFGKLAVREGAGHAQQEMGQHSLLVTGALFRDGPGFVVLDGVDAAAEELQDHACVGTH